MNQKVPYITRQIAYAFLVGLIAGGITIGLFDAYAKTPLFSSANAPSDGTSYCGEDGMICGNPYSGFRNQSQTTQRTGTNVRVLPAGPGDTDDYGNPIR